MLELDYLFQAFLEQDYPNLSQEHKQAFIALLDYSDPLLHAWCIGGEQPDDKIVAELVNRIRVSYQARNNHWGEGGG
jgi:succinate dehydrogenase flavin-adding protein (antitoxin of CptAB toxin-antitoxin module)